MVAVSASAPRAGGLLTSAGAWLACAALALPILLVVGAPLSTPDLWFHLKAGETYLHQGLWPKHDPMLFTGLASGPVQHEWLFGAFAYLCEQALGYQGLRVVHVAMVLAILGLVAWLARSAARDWPVACAVLSAFLVLAYPRLTQFRPDLWTIAAVCLVQALVLAPPEGPTRRRLAAMAGVQLVWANAHSLAAIGLALTAAALLGASFQRGILEQASDVDQALLARTSTRIRRLAWALPVLAVAGLIHPRGAAQTLTFFSSSAETAIWEVEDEWSAFDPFSHAANPKPVSLLTWLLADAVLLGFGALVAVRLRALRARAARAELERLDPPAFITATAACGAILISVRFLWLGLFPLLYLAAALSSVATRRPRPVAVAAIAASALLAALIWRPGGLSASASDIPHEPARYFATDVNRPRFADRAAQFLRDVEAEGRLFNPYELGAYYGYTLAPRLRTFIDSRTEHYGADVYEEWATITWRGVHADGRSSLQLLDDRRVDFFLGVGAPGYGYSLPYTLAHLDAQPGWLRVYRNAGQVVYLRDLPRNLRNLERVEELYGAVNVPFDRARGLDVGLVIERKPAWAVQEQLVSREFYALRARARQATGAERGAQLVKLADMRFVAGDYGGAARDVREAMQLGASGPRPAEILIAALQRSGELEAAQVVLRELARVHGAEPWARAFLARFR